MNPSAVMFTRWDKAARVQIPRMIVLISDASVVAYGDPTTQSADLARSLTESYAELSGEELRTAAADLLERYSHQTAGQGGVITFVPYEGDNKVRVDKMIKQMGGG